MIWPQHVVVFIIVLVFVTTPTSDIEQYDSECYVIIIIIIV